MKKPIVLAALSAFVLIGAAYPKAPKLAYVIDLDGGGAVAAPATGWRPCRRDRRDDNCIQLYERGVRASYAQWRAAHGEPRLAGAARHPRHRDQLALAARCAEPETAARPAAARPAEGASVSGM
jgi:hypothetical protein